MVAWVWTGGDAADGIRGARAPAPSRRALVAAAVALKVLVAGPAGAAPVAPALRFDQPFNDVPGNGTAATLRAEPPAGTARTNAPTNAPTTARTIGRASGPAYTRLDPDTALPPPSRPQHGALPAGAPASRASPSAPHLSGVSGSSASGSPASGPGRSTAAPVRLMASRSPAGEPPRRGAAAPAARPLPTARTLEAVDAASPAATTTAVLAAVSPARPIDVAPWQKVGAPYQVLGTWYIPAHEPDFDETGTARVLAASMAGRPTATGERFDPALATAAHPTLPIPSLVQVTNLDLGTSMVVRVNDRGPFGGDALIGLSPRAAGLLGVSASGTSRVRVSYIGQAGAAGAGAAPAAAPPEADPAGARTGAPGVAGRPATASPARAAAGPAAAPAARGTGPSAQPARGSLFIQVGAFASRANAERARRGAAGLAALRVVEPAGDEPSPLYRVVAGPFRDRAEADLALARAREAGVQARVIAVIDRTAR